MTNFEVNWKSYLKDIEENAEVRCVEKQRNVVAAACAAKSQGLLIWIAVYETACICAAIDQKRKLVGQQRLR